MTIQSQQYLHTPPPLYVDAVRVTAENLAEVAEWCDGKVEETNDEFRGETTPRKFVKVGVIRPQNYRQTQAFPGDWVLKTGSGLKVYTNKAFLRSFTEVVAEKNALELIL